MTSPAERYADWRKRQEDGIVVRDEEACRGARACIKACPYKKIYFNHVRNVSQHCIGCWPRLERGVAPACVRNCPGRLAFVGFLDDTSGPIHRLVHQWQVALPLHPEFGTEPNVFYVPPLSPPRVTPGGRPDPTKCSTSEQPRRRSKHRAGAASGVTRSTGSPVSSTFAAGR